MTRRQLSRREQSIPFEVLNPAGLPAGLSCRRDRESVQPTDPMRGVTCADDADRGDPASGRGLPESAVQSFVAADASMHTTPLLPSWSAITVRDGASLSSTTVPPAATAAAIRCSATSGAT